jgi:hypothetical protein
MVSDLKMSVSASGGAAVIRWGGFANFCDNPEITAACIWTRTSNTGLQQEEQSAVGNIDGQLKVGPTRGLRAPVPATVSQWQLSFFYAVTNGETEARR